MSSLMRMSRVAATALIYIVVRVFFVFFLVRVCFLYCLRRGGGGGEQACNFYSIVVISLSFYCMVLDFVS